MSAAAPLGELVAYTNEDWLEPPWQFFLNDGSMENFTGCSFAAGLRPAGTLTTTFHLTDTNARLMVTLPNEVSPTVPLADMQDLAPGQYDFDLIVTRVSGETDTLAVAVVRIIRGVAP